MKLYLAANRISTIEGLDALAPSLRVLDLGSNKIRVCDLLFALALRPRDLSVREKAWCSRARGAQAT